MGHIICYLSTMNPNLSKFEITELFEFVEVKNYEFNLTGILIHSRGNFFQILEGEKEVVKSLYERISQDERHHNLIKIIDEGGHSPLFQEYSFNFLVVNNSIKKQFLSQVFDTEFDKPSRYKAIAYLTKKFVEAAI